MVTRAAVVVMSAMSAMGCTQQSMLQGFLSTADLAESSLIVSGEWQKAWCRGDSQW